MKKVDSNNGVWINDDPATLTNGTPIDADVMNNIQDEISNVIIENGETLDGTNHSQLSQTLNKNFAKLNSPTLTGIPLTSNPDGTINNQIATVDYVNQKALQATVGFTPVQQSGGTDQGANKIYVGADKTDATQVRIQIDQSDIGKVVFQEENNDTYGIKQIGYNHTSDFISTLDSNNNYHNIHTADYIDSKQWISSLPDSNNLKVSDIIWNSSSSLPALYYGSDNSVAYLATQDWVTARYIKSSSSTTDDFVTYFTINKETKLPFVQSPSFNGPLQPYLDFTPVQQGGGVGQGANKVRIGWATDGSGLKCQVDSTDEGFISFRGDQYFIPFSGNTSNATSAAASVSFTPVRSGRVKIDFNVGQSSNNNISSINISTSGLNSLGGGGNHSATNLYVSSLLYEVSANTQAVFTVEGIFAGAATATSVGGVATFIPYND